MGDDSKRPRGRPRSVPDDVVLRLVEEEGVERAAVARAFGRHPNTIDKALARARRHPVVTVAALRRAVEQLRRGDGHFVAGCTDALCVPVCARLRQLLGAG